MYRSIQAAMRSPLTTIRVRERIFSCKMGHLWTNPISATNYRTPKWKREELRPQISLREESILKLLRITVLEASISRRDFLRKSRTLDGRKFLRSRINQGSSSKMLLAWAAPNSCRINEFSSMRLRKLWTRGRGNQESQPTTIFTQSCMALQSRFQTRARYSGRCKHLLLATTLQQSISPQTTVISSMKSNRETSINT